MLPPLPLLPTPAGTPHAPVALPLPAAPQGERAAFTPTPLPAAPQGVVHLPGGAVPRAAPLPGAEPHPENAPPAPDTSTRVALSEGTTPAPAAPGTGAGAMALVAAQMQAGGTAAMQVLLASQAAIRALPGSEHPHVAQHEAAPPEDEAAPPLPRALPPTQTDTHERHPPGQVSSHPRTQGAQGPPTENEAAEAQAKRLPPVAPPSNPQPRLGTPWLVAGAAFAALFLFAALSL